MLLILASNSPRRSAILTQLGIKFRAEPSLDEEDAAGRPPWICPALRRGKGRGRIFPERGHPHARLPDTLFLDSSPLGKPKDRADAIRTLSGTFRAHASGDIHGFAAARSGRLLASGSETTRMHLSGLRRRKIEAYVATGEPMIRRVLGCHSKFGKVRQVDRRLFLHNVVGLPVSRTLDMLCKFRRKRDVGLLNRPLLIKAPMKRWARTSPAPAMRPGLAAKTSRRRRVSAEPSRGHRGQRLEKISGGNLCAEVTSALCTSSGLDRKKVLNWFPWNTVLPILRIPYRRSGHLRSGVP